MIPEGCEPETITSDTPGLLVSCTWWSSDFSTFATRGASVRRDATPPSAAAAPSRGPDSNGWYNHGVIVEFSGADSLSGLASCSADRNYSGPDSGIAAVSGTCTDVAGNTSSASFGFQYDATPPNVEAKPDRKPNRKGWYNRKVRVDFVGKDATSGVDSCAPNVTYLGPDASKAAIAGSCTDKAANRSGEAAFELKYDTRPPSLRRVRADVRRQGIVLLWTAKDASEFSVLRKPGVNGSPSTSLYTGTKPRFVDRRVTEGVKYRYTVTAYDEAGNAAARELRVLSDVTTKPSTTASAKPALTRPAQGARVSAPPVLSWTAMPRATYYNVQLFRDGEKILTAWPTSTSLDLDRSWRFAGRTQHLEPGRYRWYVWPGFGKRSANRYGKLLGTRTFVVTRA
jgi:hypothetical protein